MTQTGVQVFDRTIQSANLWLKELMGELHTDNPHFAYVALRSVLHALRDRIPKEEAMHLAAQLPLLISGVFVDGWKLRPKPFRWHRAEFFERIHEGLRFNPQPVDPERMAVAVFKLLERHITAGEIEDIVHLLPQELKTLWPSARAAGPEQAGRLRKAA